MQTVSTGFDNAITAPIRKVHGKVVFRIIDVDAPDDVTMTASATESISDVNYVNDGTENSLVNYATFETDSWTLDGTRALLPDSSFINMGWWSSNLCDVSTKTFSSLPFVKATGTVDHSTIGLTIIFDETTGEHATSFYIIYKNGAGVTIGTDSSTNNTLVKYESSIGVSNWRSVAVYIEKWSTGGRRARMQELIFGVVEEYSGDVLRSFETTQEIDLLSSKIIPNSFKFSVDNYDRAFDINNPSGLIAYLQKQQEVQPYLGVFNGSFIEYLSMGIYYLDSWGSDRNSLEATFEGFDRSFLLGQSKYRKGVFATNDLKSIIEDVLIDAGVPPSKFSIDSALGSIYTNNPIPIDTHKEVLKHALIAGRAILTMSSEGVVTVKQLGTTTSGSSISLDHMNDYPSFDLSKVVYEIGTEVVTWTPDVSITSLFKGTINVNGTSSVWVEYDASTGHSITLSVGTLVSVSYYAFAALVTITHTGDTEVEISGYKNTRGVFVVATLTGESEGELVTVQSDLINTSTLASTVGLWTSIFYLSRKVINNEFRGDPKLEAGDIITNGTEFGDVTATIFKQVTNFDGSLKQTTLTRG